MKKFTSGRNIYGAVNNIENKSKDIYETIEKINTKMCNEIKKTVCTRMSHKKFNMYK